mgnify:FL=1
METENLPGHKIKVTLSSDEDLKDVVIVPEKYPVGWVFAGKKTNLKAGEEKIEIVEYEPSVWRNERVRLRAVTLDGTSWGEESLVLKDKKTFSEEYGTIVTISVTILLFVSLVLNLVLARKYRNLKHRKL